MSNAFCTASLFTLLAILDLSEGKIQKVTFSSDQSPPSALSGFLGYNAGDHAAKVGPWTDPSFNAAVAALSPSTIRFPCGTGGNYWDWQKGCETGSCPGTSTLENFKLTLDATNASAILVLNMLTDTLASQMQMLEHANSLGIKIAGIEFGNEFYNQEADYVKAFPQGSDYAKAVNTWLKSIRSTYPSIPLSVVGVPSYRTGNKPRLLNWNEQVFAEITGFQNGDGVTMHEYDATGVPLSSSFTSKDVPIMLGSPFVNVARIANISNSLPSWASIWITEYNLLYNTAKPDIPAYGTWSHGLYIATETLLFANTPKIAGGHQCRHALMSFAADGTLFEDTASFDFDESPNKNLVTDLYGQSAVAVTLSLIGKASFGMNSATPITFSSNPPISPGDYPSLVGTFFGRQGSSSPLTAVVINLAASEFKLTQNDAINFNSFDQVSIADATTPVNKAANDVSYKSGSVQSAGLALPAYSVTRLY